MIGLVVALLLTATCRAETLVSKGDTPAQVRKIAGEPMGKMTQGGKVIWLYRQGNVTFVNNKVADVSWLTDAQFTEKLRKQQEGKRAAAEAREKKAAAAKQAEEAKKAAAAAKKRNAPKGTLPLPQLRKRGYRPPFRRSPSDSAKFIGAIPVEFEKILVPKKLVQSQNIQIGRLTGKNRRKAFSGLQAALNRYPKELTENTVNTIYFPSQILSGVDRVGGFAELGGRNLYITSSGQFHHEFGHLLLYSFYRSFPKKEWIALNKKDYTDDGRIVRVNYEARQKYGSPYYHDKGFVNRYAMVSMHEDFAETFGITFEHSTVMDRTRKSSDLISKKLDLMVKFLNDVIKRTSGKQGTLTRDGILKSR